MDEHVAEVIAAARAVSDLAATGYQTVRDNWTVLAALRAAVLALDEAAAEATAKAEAEEATDSARQHFLSVVSSQQDVTRERVSGADEGEPMLRDEPLPQGPTDEGEQS